MNVTSEVNWNDTIEGAIDDMRVAIFEELDNLDPQDIAMAFHHTETTREFCDELDIEVSDIRHLKDIVTSLRSESAFYEVEHKRS